MGLIIPDGGLAVTCLALLINLKIVIVNPFDEYIVQLTHEKRLGWMTHSEQNL